MKLSIITINYNNAEGLRKTMESVLAQTYTEIEYIIVDGASTDGSVDVIRELATRPTIKWVSEKDTGIYNAMNKGLEIALGKRVVNDDHTSQPTPNPFLKEGEHASFAKTWGAHTADSTQYDLLKENAVNNRKNPTEAESVLWDMLKGNKIGYHFRRQHIILDYIVDFICLDKGLIIELDGGYHNDPQQKEYDQARTAHLQRLGYTELRFKNEELLCNPDAVIQKITDTLKSLPSINSLPFREGLGVGSDWQALLDKLRINGLLDYWMSKEYHDLAAQELAKVDWSKQPTSVKRIYKTPIWMLKTKRLIMRWGSFLKQMIIKLIRR